MNASRSKPAKPKANSSEDIVRALRKNILNGRWRPGAQLPPRLELMRSLKTTPPTLHHAVHRLVDDGFLRTAMGSGTFVADLPPHLNRYAVVFVFDPAAPFHEEHWSRYFQAMTQAAVRFQQETGKRMMMFHGIDWHTDSEDRARLIDAIERECLAGIIFTNNPFALENTPILEAPGIPRVAMMSVEGHSHPNVNILAFDGGMWVDKALDHLAAQGRRRVAILDFGMGPDFEARFRAGLASRGMTSHRRWRQFVSLRNPEGASHAVELLMNDRERPDALLVEDDNFVEQAAAGLAAAGIKTPDDVSIVGHANFPVPPAKVLPVRLLGYDANLFMRTAVELIDRQRAGEQVPGETILPALWEEEVGAGSGESAVDLKALANAGVRKGEGKQQNRRQTMKRMLAGIMMTVLLGAGTSSATPIVWSNPSGGDFNTGANWIGNVVPGTVDKPQFLSSTPPYTVAFSAPITNFQAEFNAAGGAAVDLDLNGLTWSVTERMWVGSSQSGNLVRFFGGGALNLSGTGSDLAVGNAGSGTTLIVTNGVAATVGRYLLVGAQNAVVVNSSNNLVKVSGAGTSLKVNKASFVGGSGDYNKVVVENGAVMTHLWDFNLGANGSGDATPTSGGDANSVTVDGGSLLSPRYMYVGYWGVGNSMLVTGGGVVSNFISYVGYNGTFSSLTIQTNSTYLCPRLTIGAEAGSSDNQMTVVGAGSSLQPGSTSQNDICVGYNGSRNTLSVLDGGMVIGNRDVYVGGGVLSSTASTGNLVRVSGAGSTLYAKRSVVVGTSTGGNNSLRIGPGCWLESGAAYASAFSIGTAGGNTITNQGGVFQFNVTTFTIANGGSAANIVIDDGTVSFRGITDASVLVSATGGKLASTVVTWSGDNTFMLNAATNINNANQAYTFQTGDPAHFARLALINASTYRGGAVTIGTGGALAVSDGASTITTDLTLSSGGTFAVQAGGPKAGVLNTDGAVVLGGAALELTLGAEPVLNAPIILINKTSGGAVSGTFATTTISADYNGKTYPMRVVYGVGDGNDVGVAFYPRGTVIAIR